MWAKDGSTSDDLYADVQNCYIDAEKQHGSEQIYTFVAFVRLRMRDAAVSDCMMLKGWSRITD